MTPLLLFLAISVKQDGTALRNGCAADAESVATLSAGARITIRYALAGEAVPCYKVAAEGNGKTIEGYLSSSQIEGIETFEHDRRDAAWIAPKTDLKEFTDTLPAMAAGAPATPSVAVQASRLIEASQPLRALQLLEAELIKEKRNPQLFTIAGVAAWKADDNRLALQYWRASLDLQPNSDLDRLYRRIERETKSDQSTQKLIGMRVALRYDPAAVAAETARQMVAALDQDFTRISAELGCAPEERIAAIVQSSDAYRRSVDAVEWNAGQFDGRIRVPVLSGQGMDAAMRRVFAHETAHACLALIGRWPAWFHEGLAQKFSGDTLSPAARQKLAAMTKEGKVPRLENLGQDWSRLDSEHARAAYAASLAAIELLYENYGQLGIANLVRNPDRLAAITADLDKRLGL